MQSKAIKLTLLFFGFIGCVVSVFGSTQLSVAPSQKVAVVSRNRQMMSRQQYHTLLHKLYGMQYNLNKLRTNKKYFLLRSQVRRLLCLLKEKYKTNMLNAKRFNHIQKNADKLDREIHRLMTKTSVL